MIAIENIQRIRSEKRISQAEMAEKLGIAQNNYGKIERGITELSVDRLFKIAEILKVSPTTILGIEESIIDKKKEKEKEISDTSKLKKRIDILEDRILDKSYKVESFEMLLNDIDQQLMVIFYDVLIQAIKDLKIGVIGWYDSINNNKKLVGFTTFKNGQSVLDAVNYKGETMLEELGIRYDFLISKQDLLQLFEYISNNYIYQRTMNLAFERISKANLDRIEKQFGLVEIKPNQIFSGATKRSIPVRIPDNIRHDSSRSNGWFLIFFLHFASVVNEYPKEINSKDVLQRLTDIYSLDKDYFKFDQE